MSFYSIDLPYSAELEHYYSVLRRWPNAVWLDSCAMARYDILTAAPYRSVLVDSPDAAAFETLRKELGGCVVAQPNVPFAGGALGYWSYDLARSLCDVATLARDEEHLPLMMVGIYDWALLVDHELRRCRLVSHRRHPETQALLDEIREKLLDASTARQSPFAVLAAPRSNFTRANYRQAFEQVQNYLQAGDCYQINLAQRYSAPAQGDGYQAYRHLRQVSPAPYAAFLDFDGVQILCASPERFLSVQAGMVETKPIKGTRPRGEDAESDQRHAHELAIHPKDRAENLMIVDLLRNDLGKCCRPGTVTVPKLFDVESYAYVHHLVSTVRGQLADGYSALDVLQACFPGGSITGAPKRRAMQIIEQLEPHRRGVYCGVIGYIGFDGNMDSNIVIRTLVYARGEIRCWAGGGIVADSDCDAEYQETLDKAAAMLAVLERFPVATGD